MSDDERDRGPEIEDDVDIGSIKRPSHYDEHGEEVFLDTKRIKTSIWLVKVPEFVMKEWGKVEKEGVELGRLRRQSNGKEDTKVTLHLPETKWAEDLPKNYVVDLMPANPTQQNTFVVHEATMRPFTDDSYRDIMKKRRDEAMAKRKNIALIHHKDGKKVMAVGSANVPTQGTAQGEFNLSQKKTTLDKRERIPEEELINQIFEAFKESSHYSFKELLERLKQPMSYLKEIVNKVCVLVKKGEEHGKYALKAEYRVLLALAGKSEPMEGTLMTVKISMRRINMIHYYLCK
ncbi:transcription initiation factor IIF, beta subunit-domain-containing protein [Chytridium lagenaria]|nr:transcription initiation factor IIF, beta subunit-domain-containing protein [Chytridium lagenaria]